MTGLLDTSMIVRYLTGDPPPLADQAARVIDQVPELTLPAVALVETAYVLTSSYKVPRATVVDTLSLFIQKRNIQIFALEKEVVLQALLLCSPSGLVSFADAMIWAAARSGESKVVYSLDRRFPGLGIEVRTRASS